MEEYKTERKRGINVGEDKGKEELEEWRRKREEK